MIARRHAEAPRDARHAGFRQDKRLARRAVGNVAALMGQEPDDQRKVVLYPVIDLLQQQHSTV